MSDWQDRTDSWTGRWEQERVDRERDFDELHDTAAGALTDTDTMRAWMAAEQAAADLEPLVGPTPTARDLGEAGTP